MKSTTLHLWPDEDATCPFCNGAITKATPLVTVKEVEERPLSGLSSLRPRDMRPICPHCKHHISAVFHFTARPDNICRSCALGQGPDGRSLGLVDGLCSRCTPDIGAALGVTSNPRNARTHVGSCPPVPAQPGEVKPGVCRACWGAQGWWDASGRADSEEKPWRTCEACKGTGKEPTNPMMVMGQMKLLKPLRFKHPTHTWTPHEFKLHGVFEIQGKEGRPDQPDDPICIIRRISTSRTDCPLNETARFSESYLVEATVPAKLDMFDDNLQPLASDNPLPVIVDANVVRQIAREWNESGGKSNVGQQLFLLLATATPVNPQ